MWYVVWVVLYYFVVFQCFGERIRREGGVTMVCISLNHSIFRTP